jgi:signal transduction histidine kinase/streptogramin lyase
LHRLNLLPQGQGKPSKISFTSYLHDPKEDKSLAGNNIRSIYEDSARMLWVNSDGIINLLDPRSGECSKRFKPDAKNSDSIYSTDTWDIAVDKNGNLWVCSGNVLHKLNKEQTSFTRYTHDPNDPASFNGTQSFGLFVDSSNILWISTVGGLDKVDLNQKAIALYRNNPSAIHSLSNNNVSAICEDKMGIVWLGTIGGGLNAWDKQNNTFTHYRDNPLKSGSIGSDSISAIIEDRKGNFWVGGGKNATGILSRLDRETDAFKNYSFKLPFNNTYGNPVLTLYEDSQGFIWVGSTGGVSRFNPETEIWVHYPYDPKKREGISDYWTTAICEDNRGNFWLGHNSYALDKLDPKTGKITHYTNIPTDSSSITSSIVTSIFKDLKGILWFATRSGGLCLLNEANETFSAFTKKDGLPSNTIYSILEDNDGNLWLTTNKGLSRFTPSTRTFTNFDKDEGLQGNQFEIRFENAGGCFKGKDGTLYFGGPNGFNVFHPHNLHINTRVPPIVITRFSLFNNPIPGKNEAKEIELNHNQNFFSFEFAALNYSSPEKNQYAYRLVGIDKDWIYSGQQRLANYTSISPGTYVFLVKASNNDGIWNEKGTAVTIIIHPPWWRTWWAYTFYGLCLLAGIFAVDRYQRQRLIQKERERAREKELAQAKEIEKAYIELKATQSQLVQREKMASLGELTAGIAHEIQNPLNFVNNFSEVNKELLTEMNDELDKGNINEVKAITKDVIDNEEKILHHGKRADAIVKGMLQHSRANTGKKEPTDINALADEYLRLSYHGLRAKDKNFNAEIKTDFDDSIGKINIVPQDIGRVLLNLFNNAFYAVVQKKKEVGEGYEPSVFVCTKKLDGKIEIHVRDNGVGIPQKVVDKIFQPFFTTKPTGQGTGLGLSLAYDIIKAHDGEIKVVTNEGKGSEFIIQLPLKNNI